MKNWQELDKELGIARRIRNKGKKGTALGLLLKELDIRSSAVRGYDDAIWKIEQGVRARCADEHGIVPGHKVMHDGQERTVRKVSAGGYVILKGVRGAFHPQRFI